MSACTIGVVGGMGPYASLRFYGRLIDAFHAEKEQDIPRIVIDSNTPIPPRDAGLYDVENRHAIVKALAESITMLHSIGASQVVICCNAAHAYLDDVRDEIPIESSCVIDIVETLASQLHREAVAEVLVLASRASRKAGLHNLALKRHGITAIYPNAESQHAIDALIQRIKRGSVEEGDCQTLNEIVSRSLGSSGNVIAGCTELPIAFDMCKPHGYRIWDPLDAAIKAIKEMRL